MRVRTWTFGDRALLSGLTENEAHDDGEHKARHRVAWSAPVIHGKRLSAECIQLDRAGNSHHTCILQKSQMTQHAGVRRVDACWMQLL